MRVLFFMRSTVYARNFESTLRLLAARGHQVHIVAETHHQVDPGDLVGRLCAEYPGITHGKPPAVAATAWSRVGLDLRRGLDYMRYLEAEYHDAPKLRHRAELKAPGFLMTPRGRRLTSTRRRRALVARGLAAADSVVPRDAHVESFVRAQRPDLVVVTPLVEPGSPQSAFLRAARSQGIRTALCVYSWDNLTNKGLIHDPLDVVTVWNEAMRREAITLHHVPPARVVVTGAAAYDHWFTWTPQTRRDEFCGRVGLDPRRPYLLYLCSSKFIAPDELPFIRRWIAETRAASPVLREAGVLIRPHPQNPRDWSDLLRAGLEQVAVWPSQGGNPADASSRAGYYDSLHHSAAVVGVNTSAQIESAIAGRGVYTVLAPEFTETQEGTLHFRHLRTEGGGLLHVAADMREHAAQLEAAIRQPEAAAERCRRFVERFVRPFGLDEPATPRLVDALEAAATRQPIRDRLPLWVSAARPVLRRAAVAVTAAGQAPLPAPTRVPRVKKKFAPASSDAEAFAHYLRARDHIGAMRAAEPGDGLTADEQQLLSAFEPLWAADPGTIASLRRAAAAAGVARYEEYAGPGVDGVRRRLDKDLRRLFKMGETALWIDEPAALGGFGVAGRGGLYNDDTVRFYRVLSLMQDAAVLRHFRGRKRRTVWEIGGGWGGFAYQFTRVCPNVTYLITAAPSLLLASAAYLMTLRPDASVRFYDPARPDDFWVDWDSVDFAFAPESVVDTMSPARDLAIELVVDIGTLDRMTTARAGAHVRRAYSLLATYFFAICGQASAVQSTVEGLYWPHPVSAAQYLERRLAVPSGTSYLLGWRRLHA